MQNKTDVLITESKKIDLSINKEKTELLTINTVEAATIIKENTQIETKEELTYLVGQFQRMKEQ